MPGQRNFIPSRPSGSSRFIRFCQAVWDRVFGPAGNFISTTTVQVEQTERGIAFHAAPSRAKPQEGAKGIGTQVQLVSVSSDTLTVQKVDDSGGATGPLVIICKPYELRQSITSESIEGGVVIDYVYDNAWTRAAYISGVFIETQIIIPRYTPGNRLQYIDCDNTGIGGLKSMDVNVAGRAWARKYV